MAVEFSPKESLKADSSLRLGYQTERNSLTISTAVACGCSFSVVSTVPVPEVHMSSTKYLSFGDAWIATDAGRRLSGGIVSEPVGEYR
jgi:hypothetical protein